MSRTALPTLLIVLFLALSGGRARADTFSDEHRFTGGSDGRLPLGVVVDKNGSQFGVTVGGGADCPQWPNSDGCGVIYRVAASGKFKVIHTFDGSDGALGQGPLSLEANMLFGTVAGGPTGSTGGVFSMTTNGSSYQLLHAFMGPDGSMLAGVLAVDADGDVFGITEFGGPGYSGGNAGSGYGVLFEIAADGTFSVLHAFTDGADGAYPTSLVRGNDGTLYGVVQSLNGSAEQSVFSFAPSTGTVTILTPAGTFGSGPNGINPVISAVDSHGNLFGYTTTMYFMPLSTETGAIFELYAKDGGYGYRFINLHVFNGNGEGAEPSGLTLDGHGDLIGTTTLGPYGTHGHNENGYGTIFSYANKTLTTLHVFTSERSGRYPAYNPAVAADGTIYGTASGGTKNCTKAPYVCGVVYSDVP